MNQGEPPLTGRFPLRRPRGNLHRLSSDPRPRMMDSSIQQGCMPKNSYDRPKVVVAVGVRLLT